jgi:mRNA interferase MazF
MHDFLRTVIAAPLTSGSHEAHYRLPVAFEDKEGRILLDQIRTLDKRRLLRRLGAANTQTLRATLAALREMFAD